MCGFSKDCYIIEVSFYTNEYLEYIIISSCPGASFKTQIGL